MTRSMTGFAALSGEKNGTGWAWDIRSVNARGLDIRLRVPDWIEGLEPAVRKAVQGAVTRGSVSVSLRVARETGEVVPGVNTAGLAAALAVLAEIAHEAGERGIALASPSPVEVAGMRGVLESGGGSENTAPLRDAMLADLPALLASFNDMRAREGAALEEVLDGQLSAVEALVEAAGVALEARGDAQRETLRAALARVMENAEGADADRVAQELAMIAVKTDIREEIDRLAAHVGAARDLLAGDAARGRKLDFLMQEFNREANTLCSKAGFAELTRIGLDLKAVIDQMREQVQNIE